MAVTVVLAVGLDPWLLATHAEIWRSVGHFVASADSIGDAIDLLLDGDFDLVVLGPSISSENREKLASLIRASGSRTPVALIGKSSSEPDLLAASRLKTDSCVLLAELRELIADVTNTSRGASSATASNFRGL